jgi:hypothetical protein
MKQLSSRTTFWYRQAQPVMWGVFGIGLVVGTHGRLGLLWIAYPCILAYTIWFARRLSDVWLDGDALQVRGPGGTLRVPLDEVLVLEGSEENSWRRPRVIVLGLDHPVGKIDRVVFVPEGEWVAFGPSPADTLEKDLRARIHAARAARKG